MCSGSGRGSGSGASGVGSGVGSGAGTGSGEGGGGGSWNEAGSGDSRRRKCVGDESSDVDGYGSTISLFSDSCSVTRPWLRLPVLRASSMFSIIEANIFPPQICGPQDMQTSMTTWGSSSVLQYMQLAILTSLDGGLWWWEFISFCGLV